MKKIKYLFLFGIIGTFIGSCFSSNPFWYNTIIRESNQTALQGLESYNYYNTMYTYDYGNNYQFYNNSGFCSYSNYLNFAFDCNGLLNSGNYLNSNLDNFVSFWSRNALYNRRTEKFINHQSSFDFDFSGNIRYSIYDCMSGSSTECIRDAYLFFSNSGEFGSLVSSEKVSYIHIIGSNYNKNPGILGENKMNHYYFLTSKRISSDYGSFYDIPNDYVRKKFYNGLNHTISSISYNSGGWLLFTSTNPLQWSYSESDNIYRLISTSYSGYLVLGVNNYLNGITQYGTIVLSMSGGNILYNYYNSYSPYLNVLSNLTPQDKGYFGNSSLFGSFINDSGTYFEVSGTPNNGNLLIRSYLNGLDAGGFYTDYNFELVSDSNIPVIIPPIGLGGGSGSQSNYSGSVSLNNCIDTQICYDYTGSQGNIIRMCTTQCVSSGVIASGGYIGSDGTYYFVNSPISINDSLKTDNPENMFTGSYIDSGGILSLSYFTDYFQPGAKKIGVCPFKYYEGPLDFMTKLKIGDVYLLMPVLCFYSAFQQGKNVSFFDQYDVNDGLFSQPMLYGESDNHKLLFAFFDVLFSIGLLGLIRYLSRHLF